MKKKSILIFLLSSPLFICLEAKHYSKITDFSPGKICFELNIDTIYHETNNLIISPKLFVDKIPGNFSLPIDKINLVRLPVHANIIIKRSDPIILKNFLPTINQKEKFSIGDSKFSDIKINNNNRKYNGGVFLTQTRDFNNEPVSLLHVNVVEQLNGDWVWYKKTNVELNWNGNQDVKLLSDEIKNQITTDTFNSRILDIQTSDYMNSNNLIRIEVNKDGLYRIPMDSLYAINPSLINVEFQKYRLYNKDIEQMIDTDPSLGIIFFGEHASPSLDAEYDYNLYKIPNVYWLTWGEGEGLRYGLEDVYPSDDMSTVQIPVSFQSNEKFESNDRLIRSVGENNNQNWDMIDRYFFDEIIYTGGNQNYYINTPNSNNNGLYRIKIRLESAIDGLRRVNINLNERFLGSAEWGGKSSEEFISDFFSNDDLINGINTLNLSVETLDDGVDKIALDWIEIDYDRNYVANNDRLLFQRDGNYDSNSHFKISGLADSEVLIYKIGQTRLTNYLPVDSGDNWEIVFQDYVFDQYQKYYISSFSSLSYPQSLSSVEPLSDIHLEQAKYIILAPDSFRQELEPMITHHGAVIKTPESIYRTYSDGLRSPYAIRNFLSDAYISWLEIPEFVLIAQDSVIPAMLIQSIGYGSTYSDYWFSLLAGNDLLPDIAVGRFPASSKDELNIMVNKNISIINQENQIWENSVLMIGGYDDEFKIQSEELIPNIIQNGFFTKRLYVDLFSEDGPFYGSTNTLLDYFEDGVSYINFFGHGGGAVWGDRSLFTGSSYDNLDNLGKLPFITSMTCYTSDLFHWNSLGKNMLSYQNGGAYSWFGSSGISWLTNNFLLLESIHNHLFSNDMQDMPIGNLINQAKVDYLFNNNTWPEIAVSQIFQYNLFGDPGLNKPIYNKANIEPDNYSVASGSNIDLNIVDQNIDSISIQLLDDNYFPLTNVLSLNEPIFTVPSDIDSGQITLSGVYKNLNNNYQFSVSMNVNNPFIEIINILPEYPVLGDSISINAIIDYPDQVSIVECWVDSSFHSNMSNKGNFIYELDTKLPTLNFESNNINAYLRVITSENSIKYSNSFNIGLYSEIDVYPVSIDLPLSNQIGLSNLFINETNGHGNINIALEIQKEGDEPYVQLFQESYDVVSYEQISKTFETPFPSGKHNFKLSVVNNKKHDSDTTYFLDTSITINRFFITPEHGTTEDLQGNDTVTFESLDFFISPGIIDENDMVSFENMISVNIRETQASLVPVIEYVGLNPLLIKMDNKINWTGNWKHERALTDTLLFQLNPESGIWYPLFGEWKNNTFQFDGSGTTSLAWIKSNDNTPPYLEAFIDGQQLSRGSFISPNPDITIHARDESGIDIENSKFFKNGSDWDMPKNEIKITSNGILTQLNFKPKLNSNDKTIEILLSDMMENVSDTLNLKFFIAEEMELMDYGNFPNPFNISTMFTYELTRSVEDLTLTIYTIDGRKIKEFNNTNYDLGSNLNLNGYHEIIWDGKDKWGSEIANGIYFYKYKLKFDDKSYTSIGKVARSR